VETEEGRRGVRDGEEERVGRVTEREEVSVYFEYSLRVLEESH
jgi:hypothetical protein